MDELSLWRFPQTQGVLGRPAVLSLQEKTSTKTSSQRDGSACLRVFGDNRCLFRALIRQFSREFDGPRDLWGKSFGAGIERSERSAADQLRDKVGDYMDDHVATLQHPADIFGGRDPDEYIAWMRVRSTWGGDPEIHVVHLCTGERIRVWKPDQGTYLLLQNYGEASPRDANVVDIVWVSGNHYDIFLPSVAFPETFGF